MADEINKRKPNIKPYTTAIDRMRSESRKPTAEIIKEKSAIERQQENYDKAKSENDTMLYQRVGMDPDKVMDNLRQMERSEKSRSLHEDNLSTLWTARKQVAENQFVSQVRNISTGSPSSLEQARASVAARELINSGAYNESSIAKGLNRIPRQIDERQKRVVEMASDPKGNVEDFLKAAEGLESSKIKYQNLRVGEKEIKRLGLDSASVIKSSYDTKDSILNSRASDSLSDRVASGATGTMKEESSKLKESEDRFLEAQKKFADALSSGEEDVEGFKKALTDSTKSLEEQKKLVDEMKRQGAGGGGRSIGDILQSVGGALQTGAGIAMDATVTSNIRQNNLRAGFAGVQNEIFDLEMSAGMGDIGALKTLQTMSGMNTLREAQGTQDKAGKIKVVDAAGGIGKTAGGALNKIAEDKAQHAAAASIGAGIGSFVPVIGTAIGGALGTAASVLGSAYSGSKGTIQSTAAAGVDAYKGLTAGEAGLADYNSRMNIARQLSHVSSVTGKMFTGMVDNAYAGTQGMGSARSSVFDYATSGKGLSEMQSFGLGSKDLAQMAHTASSSMGTAFREMSQSDREDLFKKAGAAKTAGIASPEEYIARVGDMAQIGGGKKEIEDILANAVARGVDGAAALKDLAAATQDLASASAGRGVGSAGAVTKSLISAMDFAKEAGMSDKMAQAAAKSGIQRFDSLAKGTDLDLPTMIASSKMASSLGLSGFSLSTALKADRKDLQGIRDNLNSKDPKKKKEAENNIRLLGLSEAVYGEGGDVKGAAARVDRLLDIQNSRPGDYAMGLLSPKDQEDVDKYQKGQISLDQLSNKAKDYVSQTGGGEGYTASRGQDGKKGMVSQKKSAELAGAEALGRGRAETERKGIESARKGIGGVAGYGGAIEGAASRTDPDSSEKKAAQAAGEMKLDSSKFDGSVDKFDKAVDKLIEKMGIKGTINSPEMKAATKQAVELYRQGMSKLENKRMGAKP